MCPLVAKERRILEPHGTTVACLTPYQKGEYKYEKETHVFTPTPMYPYTHTHSCTHVSEAYRLKEVNLFFSMEIRNPKIKAKPLSLVIG